VDVPDLARPPDRNFVFNDDCPDFLSGRHDIVGVILFVFLGKGMAVDGGAEVAIGNITERTVVRPDDLSGVTRQHVQRFLERLRSVCISEGPISFADNRSLSCVIVRPPGRSGSTSRAGEAAS
jgi:hypothetical protein